VANVQAAGRRRRLASAFLDPVDGLLPAHVLLDRQVFERLDRSFGRVLRLQVGLKDADIVIEPLQVLFLHRGDAFHYFAGVESGLRVCEWVGGSGWRLAFNERDAISADAEPLKVGSGDVQIDFLATMMYFADLVDELRTRRVFTGQAQLMMRQESLLRGKIVRVPIIGKS
jgi:hypothetical protein